MREVAGGRLDRGAFRAPAGRGSRSHEPGRGRRLLAAIMQRPGLLAGGLVIGATSTAIIVNALSFQSARHPAPIFAKGQRPAAGARAPVMPSAPTPPPVPPTRPPSVESTAALQPVPRSTSRDSIADLIRGSDTTGSASPARAVDAKPEPRQVAAAQQALIKLGYGPLKADGILGQGTRQAIERFERDRRLAATGELGPRTVRALVAQSGVRIE